MDEALIQAELDSIADAEVLESVPAATELYTNDLVDSVYDESGAVIWPGPMGG
jgi:hypothetical protein